MADNAVLCLVVIVDLVLVVVQVLEDTVNRRNEQLQTRLSFRSFAVKDVALFLPIRTPEGKHTYLAFNERRPHRYLPPPAPPPTATAIVAAWDPKSQTRDQARPQGRITREYIQARAMTRPMPRANTQ